jgi:hypothetical protein
VWRLHVKYIYDHSGGRRRQFSLSKTPSYPDILTGTIMLETPESAVENAHALLTLTVQIGYVGQSRRLAAVW